MIALSVDAPRKITAFLIFMFLTFVAGVFWGQWRTNKRWEKATADVMWHCIEQHTGPAEPDPVVHPKTDEKAFFMVPMEEPPVEEVSTH
jgi:hypothetical protein